MICHATTHDFRYYPQFWDDLRDNSLHCKFRILYALVRPALYLGCALLMSSCTVVRLFKWTPTYGKPSSDQLSGKYTVDEVTWFVPNRKDLKEVSLILSKDGSYRLRSNNPNLSSPLIPAQAGEWSIEPMRGMDLGSRETWGVRFSLPNGRSTSAFCLEPSAPYRLLFDDYSRRSGGGMLILKRADEKAETVPPRSKPSP